MPKVTKKKQAETTEPPMPAGKPQPLVDDTAKRHFEALQIVRGLLDDISIHDLEMLECFKLILDRNHGSDTPIEEFIWSVVMAYKYHDKQGRGATMEDIDSALEELRENLPFQIKNAHNLANRYPKPLSEVPNAE